MDSNLTSLTSVTLLHRIRNAPPDSHAWTEFVQRYGFRIHQWCTSRGLGPADADDVTQEVLIKLARRLNRFEYDPNMTFRGWLRRVTENALLDFFRDRKRREAIRSQEVSILERAEERQELASRLEDAFDLELFELALARVRNRIDRRRWSAWQMTAMDGIAAEAVAEQLGMKIATVYSARYQIQKMIAAEVQLLEAAQ